MRHIYIYKNVLTMFQQRLHFLVNSVYKLNFSVILKVSKFTNATNKFWSLVMNCLADVCGFKICIQVCVRLGFPSPDEGHDTMLLFTDCYSKCRLVVLSSNNQWCGGITIRHCE